MFSSLIMPALTGVLSSGLPGFAEADKTRQNRNAMELAVMSGQELPAAKQGADAVKKPEIAQQVAPGQNSSQQGATNSVGSFASQLGNSLNSLTGSMAGSDPANTLKQIQALLKIGGV